MVLFMWDLWFIWGSWVGVGFLWYDIDCVDIKVKGNSWNDGFFICLFCLIV